MKIDSRSLMGGEELLAADLFTDRVPESTAFKNALASFRRALDSEETDPNIRNNVLVYYGLGGIGKTELSQRLERWARGKLPLANGWGSRPSTAVDALIRVDLKDLGGQFDAVSSIVSIRRELGRLKKKWPAFDLAFAAYWEAAHPGMDLPTMGKPDNGFADAVAESVGNVLADLGSLSTAVGLGIRSVRTVVDELQRRNNQQLAFDSFDGYRALLARCADLPSPSDPRPDIALDLVVLLSMEMSSYWEEKTPLVVVFVDTVERLALDDRKTGEKLLNALVWQMPNILFVITGRSKLDWFDERRTSLRAVGPTIWPGLAGQSIAEARQHRVGKLSESDRNKFIIRSCEANDLLMADDTRNQLVISSGGLPLYLDLAIEKAISVKQNWHREVTVEEVTGSFDELVDRVLEDVASDERRALFAASMFPCFDSELVAIAANVENGCAERALRRSMIEYQDGERYPYRMHDEIRSAIRFSTERVPGGWAEIDWRRAGSRALSEAHKRFLVAATNGDGQACLSTLGLAIGIVCEQDVDIERPISSGYADWIAKAIVYGPSVPGLRNYIPATSKTEYGRVVLDFVTSKSYETPISERFSLLRRIFDSDHPLADTSGRHLAYGLRNNGQCNQALAVFDELISRDPSELHRGQRLVTLLHDRRFSDAAGNMAELTQDRQDSIRTKIEMSHGSWRAWLSRLPAAVSESERRGSQRERLEAVGTLLRWRSLLLGDVELSEANDLLAEAEAVGYDVAARDALVCLSLLKRIGHTDDFATVRLLERTDIAANSGHIGYRTGLVKSVRAFVNDDAAALIELREEIELIPNRGRLWIPIECLLDSVGFPVTAPATQWLEPYSEVRGRWRQIFDNYRELNRL